MIRGRFKAKRARLVPKGIKRGKTRPRGKLQALWGQYGLLVPRYRRYSGRKGIYWYLFSKEIRARDYREHGGLCMTCLKYVEKGSDQCGHLFPARDCGFLLLFEPRNNHLQHSKCNNPRFTPGAGIYNTINIEARYGAGTVAKLAATKLLKGKEWSQKEYDERIKEKNRPHLPPRERISYPLVMFDNQ